VFFHGSRGRRHPAFGLDAESLRIEVETLGLGKVLRQHAREQGRDCIADLPILLETRRPLWPHERIGEALDTPDSRTVITRSYL